MKRAERSAAAKWHQRRGGGGMRENGMKNSEGPLRLQRGQQMRWARLKGAEVSRKDRD